MFDAEEFASAVYAIAGATPLDPVPLYRLMERVAAGAICDLSAALPAGRAMLTWRGGRPYVLVSSNGDTDAVVEACARGVALKWAHRRHIALSPAELDAAAREILLPSVALRRARRLRLPESELRRLFPLAPQYLLGYARDVVTG